MVCARLGVGAFPYVVGFVQIRVSYWISLAERSVSPEESLILPYLHLVRIVHLSNWVRRRHRKHISTSTSFRVYPSPVQPKCLSGLGKVEGSLHMYGALTMKAYLTIWRVCELLLFYYNVDPFIVVSQSRHYLSLG